MTLDLAELVIALMGAGALMLLGNVRGYDKGRAVGFEEGKLEGYTEGWRSALKHAKAMKKLKKLKKDKKEEDRG